MIRITTHDADNVLVMKLEGCLRGPWVPEAQRLWGQVMQRRGHRTVRVDLTALCLVDDGGRRLMTRMLRDGAELVTAGCEMPEIVREIAGALQPAPAPVRRN